MFPLRMSLLRRDEYRMPARSPGAILSCLGATRPYEALDDVPDAITLAVLVLYLARA